MIRKARFIFLLRSREDSGWLVLVISCIRYNHLMLITLFYCSLPPANEDGRFTANTKAMAPPPFALHYNNYLPATIDA